MRVLSMHVIPMSRIISQISTKQYCNQIDTFKFVYSSIPWIFLDSWSCQICDYMFVYFKFRLCLVCIIIHVRFTCTFNTGLCCNNYPQ